MAAESEGLTQPNLVELISYAAKHRGILLGIPFVCAIAAAGVSLLLPPTYTASTYLLAPQTPPGASTMQLLSMAGGGSGSFPAGIAAMLGVKSSADIYVGILGSRTIADKLIDRFDLKKRYNEATLTDTRRTLGRLTRVSAGKEGLITVEFEDEDPAFAARVANGYVEELDVLLQGLAITEAGQRRLFFEKQVQKVKGDLVSAEFALTSIQERTGVIKLEEQGRIILEAIAALRGQVVAKETQLSVMRSFASDRNPEVERTVQELASLKSQLRKLESEGGGPDARVFVPTGRVPKAGLEFLRGYREVKYHEALFEAMLRQLELAKVEEARSGPIVQVVDRAVEPDKRTRPRRRVIVLTVAALALMASAIFVVMRYIWESSATPTTRSQISEAVRAFIRIRARRGNPPA